MFLEKLYNSRHTLFNVHGINTFRSKNRLTRNDLPELIISLNSRRENTNFLIVVVFLIVFSQIEAVKSLILENYLSFFLLHSFL